MKSKKNEIKIIYHYNPDKILKHELLRLEKQLLSAREKVNLILARLESSTDALEYSSDAHQLVESVSSSINSAYLATNIVNHGIEIELWENDNERS